MAANQTSTTVKFTEKAAMFTEKHALVKKYF